VTYQVFARKYRPQLFEEVLGQDTVVRTLRNAIKNGRLAHAYLLSVRAGWARPRPRAFLPRR